MRSRRIEGARTDAENRGTDAVHTDAVHSDAVHSDAVIADTVYTDAVNSGSLMRTGIAETEAFGQGRGR